MANRSQSFEESLVAVQKFMEHSSQDGLTDLVSLIISLLSEDELGKLSSKIYEDYPSSDKAETLAILLVFNTEHFKTGLLSFNHSTPKSVTEI